MISKKDVVIFDEAGIPSIMVKFTPEKNKDLFPGGSDATHPAFIINGEEVNEIYISKYECTMINGKPYSLPFTVPAANITYDEAMAACYAKGAGWHMLTAAEAGLLVLDSKRKDTLPHGNTSWGKYHADPEEHGVLSKYGAVLTGSGPATWAHDHTVDGVYDLCGNLWEWMAGLRLMNGEIQVIENNNAANPIDTSADSPNWKPILQNKKPVCFAVDAENDEIHMTTERFDDESWTGCRWNELVADVEAPEILKALALFPADDKDGKAGLWIDPDEERLPIRGAHWDSASDAGVAALYLNYPRSSSGSYVGFRAAFYRKTDN